MNPGPPFKRKKLEPNENHLNIAEKIPKYANVGDEDDDISDSDLILASQMVEAKYCSTMRDTHQDDYLNELNKLKTENYQKDGEVKILREKLKKIEIELNKFRNEKNELLKKYQLNFEEQQKALKKQIDAKELEVQFKNQEITELTMKYKLLESQMKKSNPNSKPVSLQNRSTSFNDEAKTIFGESLKAKQQVLTIKRKNRVKTTANNYNSVALKEALTSYLILDDKNQSLIDEFMVLFESRDFTNNSIYLMIDLFQHVLNDLDDIDKNQIKLKKFLVFLRLVNIDIVNENSIKNDNLTVLTDKISDKISKIVSLNVSSSIICICLEIFSNIYIYMTKLKLESQTWPQLSCIVSLILKSKQNSFDLLESLLIVFKQIGHKTDDSCLLALYYEKLINFFDDNQLNNVTIDNIAKYFNNFLDFVTIFILNSQTRQTCICIRDNIFCLLLLIDHLFTDTFLNNKILCLINTNGISTQLMIRALSLIVKLNNQQTNLFDDLYFDSILKEDFRYKNFNCLLRLMEKLLIQKDISSNETQNESCNHLYLNLVSIKNYFKLCNDLN